VLVAHWGWPWRARERECEREAQALSRGFRGLQPASMTRWIHGTSCRANGKQTCPCLGDHRWTRQKGGLGAREGTGEVDRVRERRQGSTSWTSRSCQMKKGEEDLSPLHMHGLTRFYPREGEREGSSWVREGAAWWCESSWTCVCAGVEEWWERWQIERDGECGRHGLLPLSNFLCIFNKHS
jgi:hypothetical protein